VSLLPHPVYTIAPFHPGSPAAADPPRSASQRPSTLRHWTLFCILWLVHSLAHATGIQINEVFFHPPSHQDREEWIELANTGSEPIDLAGWRFTRGIRFEFPPNTWIGPSEFLVIAADPVAFKSRHPDVPHVVGGWRGQLANSGQTLQLDDADGRPIEVIEYSDHGEWATRVPGPLSRGYTGWEWSSAADGLGASLERIQPLLPGNHGQNWLTSLGTNGTPGSINSRFATNLPPIILDVAHSPLVPRSNEVVAVTARLIDESTHLLAHVHWRLDGTKEFQSVTLSDNGPPGDRTPGDGRYTALLPAHPEGSIIEFYVSAEDSAGLRRTWPAPAQVAGAPAQILNALYQVDSSIPNTSKGVGIPPLYRLVLTAADRQILADINRNFGFSAQSRAQFNATFIAEEADGTSLRYTTGVRNRGNGSAARQPQSFRVNFRHDDRWKDVDGLNLNSQYTPVQLFGSALYRKSGLPAALARPARVRVNANTLSDRATPTFGFYVANELIDSDFAKSQFPSDPGGNVYRGIRASGRGADLHYEGELPAPYRINYSKRTHVSQDDWSDLIGLCRVIGDTNAVSPIWIDQIRDVLDVEQWMLYFALETIVDNRETNLGNGNNGTGQGDDYFLYFGTLDTRARVIPYDLDTILGVGDSPFNPEDGLFRMNSNPWIGRILRQPAFAAVYYRTLQRLLDGPCSAAQFDALVDEVLGGLGVETQMTTMKQFATARRSALERLIPRTLSLTNADWPTVEGTLQINSPTVRLGGRANAATTFGVKLNGVDTSYSHMDATWVAPQVPLNPGLNILVLSAHDESGQEIERLAIRAFRPSDSFLALPSTITSDQVLQATLGPFLVSQSLIVESNATLRIEAGAVLYFGTNASVLVQPGSKLVVEGTELLPVRFLPQPGSTEPWSGIVLRSGSEPATARLIHVDFEGTQGTALDMEGSTLTLEHASFRATSGSCLRLRNSSFEVRDSSFASSEVTTPLVECLDGIPPGGQGLFRRCFFAPVPTQSPQLRIQGGHRFSLEPIVHVFDCVFTGAASSALELAGADSWIEGTLFLQSGTTAIRGIGQGLSPSSATLLRNGFLGGARAIDARDDSFFVVLNNTFLRIAPPSTNGPTLNAVLSIQDPPADPNPATHPGKGFYFGANIASESGPLILPNPAPPEVLTADNNVISTPWNGRGTNNHVGNPHFRGLNSLTDFTVQNWSQAQQLWDRIALADGSPAIRRGFNSQDAGAAIPPGISVSGEPTIPTPDSTVQLVFGPSFGHPEVPESLWPRGAGFTHFRYKLDAMEWSPWIPIQTPLILSNLGPGTHQLTFVGLPDSGSLPDAESTGTQSITWTVDPPAPPRHAAQRVQLHEIRAARAGVGDPAYDAIELFNPSDSPAILTGFSLAQSTTDPRRYVFPDGTTIPPRGYLILHASATPDPSHPFHTGFGLDASGDTVLLFDAQSQRQDSIRFGLQVPGYSIGRVLSTGLSHHSKLANPGWVWTLCEPTLGGANLPALLGDPTTIRISEWLASPGILFAEDFVELQNPTSLPIALDGLFLTDYPTTLLPNFEPVPSSGLSAYIPNGTRLGPLSFLAPMGSQELRYAGNSETNADRIGFKLSSDTGTLALYETTDSRTSANHPWSIVRLVDFISYQSQYPGVSQGRSSGFAGLRYFLNPTPGIANPATQIPGTNAVPSLVLNEVLSHNRNLRDPDGQFPDWVEIYNPNPIPISLAGIQLTDDLRIPDRFVFPSGSEVAGFGQVLVRCQAPSPIDESDGLAAAPPTPFQATFGLNRNGGSLFLLGSTSHNTPMLDQIHYGILPADFTLARFPDATGPWMLSQPTPLNANQPAELGNPSTLRLNEWMANPISGNDWFELYNPDSLPIDLSRFTLSDDPANPAKHPIAPLSFIAGKTHLQFHADDQPSQGPHHVRFQLSNRGEFIGLYSPDGIEIDSVSFGPQVEGISEGRLPDGSVNVARFTAEGTPGSSNWVDSDFDGQPDPWELDHGLSPENPGDALLDADQDGMSNRDEFRAGTDPVDGSDFLHLDLIRSDGDRVELEFRAHPGHAYRIQVRDALDAPWRDLESVPPRGLPRRIRMPITPTGPSQYLRLVLLPP
jgi:hypothetical protein